MWGIYVSRPTLAQSSDGSDAAGGKVKYRGSLAALHGLGLAILLISGFGMLARLGILKDLPGWAYGKLAIWLVLGASVALAKRKATWGNKLLTAWIALGTLAAYLCIYKP